MANQSATTGISLKLFSVGKWFSLFFSFLALIAVIIGAVYLLSLSSSFRTPNFDVQAQKVMIGNMSTQQSNIANQKENVKLNEEYGSHIVGIISKYEIQDIKTAQIINILLGMPEKYRSDFMSGWKSFLRQGVSYAKKNGVFQVATTVTNNGLFGGENSTPGTADILTSQYINEYSNAIASANEDKNKNRIERLSLFGLIVSAMIVFILAMVVPILVQIEKNTRRFASVDTLPSSPAMAVRTTLVPTSSEPAVNSARLCPKCHSTIAEGDVFCGNCGANLR